VFSAKQTHAQELEHFRAAVSVLVGPCCPALLNCIDADIISGISDVHTVVLLGKQNDDESSCVDDVSAVLCATQTDVHVFTIQLFCNLFPFVTKH